MNLKTRITVLEAQAPSESHTPFVAIERWIVSPDGSRYLGVRRDLVSHTTTYFDKAGNVRGTSCNEAA